MADSYAPHKSLASILAIIAAIASFFVHWAPGILLAVAAIVLGLLGVALSILPRTRGGIISVLAILLGLIGIICGVIRMLYHGARHL
ncbi:MAG TPA: hypothetical protein VGI81_07280 [Tepidisphaeraceae bacterium]|jgi:hypothetical protein